MSMVKLKRKGVWLPVKWIDWYGKLQEEVFTGYYLGRFKVDDRNIYAFYDPKDGSYYIAFYLEGFDFSEIPEKAKIEVYRRGDWEVYYDPDDVIQDIELPSLLYCEEALRDEVKLRLEFYYG